jgi:Trk K+ transport system NAD-binding subunit
MSVAHWIINVCQKEALSNQNKDRAQIMVDPASDFHASGKTVAELALPRAAVIVSVRRGHDLLIPHGDTRLQNGDAVTVLCERQCIDEVKAAFANNNKPVVVGKTD